MNMFGYQIKALGDLVGRSVSESNISPVAEQVGGVVAVGSIVGDLVSLRDLLALVNLTAIVSLSLAFVNILPIPLLDGGQAAIVIIEGITRRKVPQSLLQKVNTASLVFIIVLSVAVTLKDLIQTNVINNIFSGLRDLSGR